MNLCSIIIVLIPKCDAIRGFRVFPQEIRSDGAFLVRHDASNGPNGTSNVNGTGIADIQNGALEEPVLENVYLDNTFPITPVAGMHVIRIKRGKEHLR